MNNNSIYDWSQNLIHSYQFILDKEKTFVGLKSGIYTYTAIKINNLKLYLHYNIFSYNDSEYLRPINFKFLYTIAIFK